MRARAAKSIVGHAHSVARVGDAAYASPMRHPATLPSGDLAWTKIRILVFSQDDGFRFLVRQTFRKVNVREVLSTSVSADATPMMGQAPDLGLVDMEGDAAMALAFLERVRAADAEMPVLMVVRADDRSLVTQALPLGIEGMLPKPVSGHELLHRVGATMKAPKRLPAPAGVVRPPLILDNAPAPVQPPPPTPGALGPPAAKPDTVKAELAALAARLGRTAGGGTYGAAGGSGKSGGSGGGRLSAEDLVPATAGGRRLASDDIAGAPLARSGGTLGDDDLPPAKPRAKSRRETLADALPEALRPKRRTEDEATARAAEAERARWQEELAQAGHEERTGKDVAGLDVDAIVAQHVLWLTSQGGQGKRATFQGMDLAGGDLGRTVLANATFRETDLSDAVLVEARLDGADFRYASLSAADLTGANLGVAQLRHANLRLANLQGATLRGADLSGARLAGAKLAGADFKGATLVGADLADADLSQVENLTQGQVDKAVCDMKTKLPPGVFRPRKDQDG